MTYEEFKSIINQFNRDLPRPGIPPLEVSELLQIQSGFLTKIPNRERAGVYAVFAETELLYVGKVSSGSNLKQRMHGHFYADGRPKPTKKDQYKWRPEARQIAVIPLPRNHDFEAAAIEEYLIRECTLRNCVGYTGRKAAQLVADLLASSGHVAAIPAPADVTNLIEEQRKMD